MCPVAAMTNPSTKKNDPSDPHKIFMLKLATMKCECECLDSEQDIRNLFIQHFATGVSYGARFGLDITARHMQSAHPRFIYIFNIVPP